MERTASFEPCPEEESVDPGAGSSLTDGPLFQRVSITGEEDTGGVSETLFFPYSVLLSSGVW